MLFHARARRSWIAALDGVNDREVRFRRALLERTEVHPERHEAIDFRETAIDEFHRQGIARGRGDGEMETDVGRLRVAILGRRVTPAMTRIGGNRLRERGEMTKLRDLLVGGALCPRGGRALEHSAHVEGFVINWTVTRATK